MRALARGDGAFPAASAIALLALGWPFSHIYRSREQMSFLLIEAERFRADLALIGAVTLGTAVLLAGARRHLGERAYWRLRMALLLIAFLHLLRFLVPALADAAGAGEHAALPTALAALAAIALAGVPLGDPERWAPRWRTVEIIALLIGGILLINGFLHGRFYTNEVRAPLPAAAPPAAPEIYFFVLDSLGYDVLFREGQPSPRYPAFRALAESSHVFHQARAPDMETAKSIPKLLTGVSVDARYRPGDHRYELRPLRHAGQEFHAFADQASLFQQFSATHRFRILGYGLPYCDFARSFVYRCRTFSYYPATVPAMVREGFGLPYQYRQMMAQERAFFEHLDEPVANRFYYAHFFVPHARYILRREGLRPDYRKNQASTPENFALQVEYADAMLGRIFTELRRLGKFDPALIVVTADHGPEYLPYAQRGHVPLFVKLPGQTQGVSHREAASTLRLKDVLWQAVHGHRFEPSTLSQAHLGPEDLRLTIDGSFLKPEERL